MKITHSADATGDDSPLPVAPHNVDVHSIEAHPPTDRVGEAAELTVSP